MLQRARELTAQTWPMISLVHEAKCASVAGLYNLVRISPDSFGGTT